MTTGIYSLTFAPTGEVLWIGQSVNIELRFRKHLTRLKTRRHSQKPFSDWFHDGNISKEDIVLSVLEVCSPEDLNEYEGFWFEKLPPRFFGQVPSTSRRWFLSEETKLRIAAGQKVSIAKRKADGVYISPWDNQSEDERQANLDRLKRNGFSSESAAKAGRNGSLGKAKSPAHRQKLAEAQKAQSSVIHLCPLCGRPCKGKTALARHTSAHK